MVEPEVGDDGDGDEDTDDVAVGQRTPSVDSSSSFDTEGTIDEEEP